MSEKMTWVELRQQVADRAGVKEAEAGQFLNALVHQIQEGLKTDRMVRLTGLGTFRVQAVAPRKSVNVTTGEAFTIEGYNKLAFSAEAGAKELIESAGSTKSALEDDITPIKKLGAQADEIVDLLAELGQMPNTEENVDVDVDVDVDDNENDNENVDADADVEEKKEEGTENREVGSGKKPVPGALKWLRDVIITVAVLLLLVFGGIFLLREGLSDLFESLAGTEKVEVARSANDNVDVDVDVDENVEAIETREEAQETRDERREGERVYTEFITTEEMHQDSRLAWMAYRYYGNKELWVFIYEANMDHIANPNHIQVGTPIRIPKLSAEMMDTNNPNTRKALDELQARFGK